MKGCFQWATTMRSSDAVTSSRKSSAASLKAGSGRDSDSEQEVVGGNRRAVVPTGIRAQRPDSLHAALGQKLPVAVLDGWPGLSELRASLALSAHSQHANVHEVLNPIRAGNPDDQLVVEARRIAAHH